MILLETNRLRLIALTDQHLSIYTSLYGDAVMMQYLGGPLSDDRIETMLNQRIAAMSKPDAQFHFALLELSGSGEIVGTSGIRESRIPAESGFELGWMILPGYQGAGYATEITRSLVKYARDSLDTDRLIAQTHPDNTAAAAVLRRSDFAFVRAIRSELEDFPELSEMHLWEYRIGSLES